MTPAINCAKKAAIDFNIHEYQHDPSAASYGEEAAQALNISADQVFKTLLVAISDGKKQADQKQLAVAVIPVSQQLNLKAMAKALGCKKVEMADPKAAERSTGYILGGISPLGQKKALKTVIDLSAENQTTVFISAGRRGLEIELAAADLAQLTRGQFAALS